MTIVPTTKKDAEDIAWVVSESNKDVAKLFGLHVKNAPKHPSFCTKNWILSDMDRGEQYFLYKDDTVSVGSVAFEQPDPDTAYLNRLSVLPAHRHLGIGSELVKFIIEYSKKRETKIVSIGIIAEHSLLKNWYVNLGFVEGELRTFEHLPFNVQYLNYKLE